MDIALLETLQRSKIALTLSNKLLIKASATSKQGFISDDEACRVRMNARAIARITKSINLLIDSHVEITPIF